MLKRILNNLRHFLDQFFDVRYTIVPVLRPRRDF